MMIDHESQLRHRRMRQLRSRGLCSCKRGRAHTQTHGACHRKWNAPAQAQVHLSIL